MQSAKKLNLFINIGGSLIGVFVLGYVVYSAYHTATEPPCSARYPAPMRFALQTATGKTLTPIELQARAGLRDVGVIDNAAVVAVNDGPTPEALEVKLRSLPGGDDADAKTRNGIEFRWSPPGISGATATCLAYSVWLPDKFDFGDGGFLPGVFGGDPAMTRQQAAKDLLTVALEWSDEGKPSLTAAVDGSERLRLSGAGTPLAAARWTKVEQEVVLNDPGQLNGTLRLWVDGELIAENLHVELRKDDKVVLTGVLASIGYEGTPPPNSLLRLSPIEIARH
jgi:hypothetical protein